MMKRKLSVIGFFCVYSLFFIVGCEAQQGSGNEVDEISYSLGILMGQSLQGQQFDDIDYERFTKGVKDAMSGGELEISMEDAMEKIQAYQQKQISSNTLAAQEEEDAFMAENAQKEGIKVTDSGLQYKVLKEGTGPFPTAESTVNVDYEGSLLDGSVFDSSYDRGEPVEFKLNQVIPGWTEGLQLMKEGGKYEFYIPARLGYGAQSPSPSIPPHSTLKFVVELHKVL